MNALGRTWLRVGGMLLTATTLSVACGDDDDSPKPQAEGGETGSAGSPAVNGGAASPGDGGAEPGLGGVGSTPEAGRGGEGGVTDVPVEGGAAGVSTAGGAGGAGGGNSGPETLFDCSAPAGEAQALQLTEISKVFDYPITVAQPLGETERLFVAELKGLVRILKNGTLAPEPFIDLTAKVGLLAPERGLVALAFHPNYAENGRFFVVYTKDPTTGGSLQLSEFSRADADHAAPTEKPLLEVTLTKSNHISRALAFGPDGNLYWALGDGGGSGDEGLQGQLATGLFGKVVRIDVDSKPAASKAYAIPAGNMAGGAPERWAFGLRFPLGLSFDACTGDLFLTDSGKDHQEVNYLPAGQASGANFGWSMYDANACFKPACIPAGKTFPLYESATAFRINGGFVYRGSALPSFRGHYFAIDLDQQFAIALQIVNGAPVVRNLSADLGAKLLGTQGIGQDSRGELYVTNSNGSVYRIDPEN